MKKAFLFYVFQTALSMVSWYLGGGVLRPSGRICSTKLDPDKVRNSSASLLLKSRANPNIERSLIRSLALFKVCKKIAAILDFCRCSVGYAPSVSQLLLYAARSPLKGATE